MQTTNFQPVNNFSSFSTNNFYSDVNSYDNLQNLSTEKYKMKIMEKDKLIFDNSKIIKENEKIIDNLKREIDNKKDEINKLKENIQKWVLQLEKKSKKE